MFIIHDEFLEKYSFFLLSNVKLLHVQNKFRRNILVSYYYGKKLNLFLIMKPIYDS